MTTEKDSSNNSKNAVDAPSLKGFRVDPEKLTIIGYDTDDGPEHDLYNEESNKTPVPESLILNIMSIGIIEPVKFRKDADKRICVVVGRHRTRAAREANKRLRAAGCDPVMVPIVKQDGDDMSAVIISENRLRRSHTVLDDAREAARYMAKGHSEAKTATTFGVSKSKVCWWNKLLELDPSLLKAVEKGEISASQALEKSGAGIEAQRALASEVKGKKANKPGRPKGKKAERPGKPQILKMLEKVSKVKRLEHLAPALRWCAGEITDDALLG